MKRALSRIFSVIMIILMSACMGLSVMAAGSYEPLTVSVPVSGKGTYILSPVSADAPSPSSEEITVDGKGSWNVTFTEPGTYDYELSDKNNAANRRDVSIYVENSEGGLGLKGTVLMSKDGEKMDADFTVNSTEEEEEEKKRRTTEKESTEKETTEKETTENSGTDTSSDTVKKSKTSGGTTSGGSGKSASSSELSSTGSRTGTGGHPRTGDSGWMGYAGLAGGSLAMILVLLGALRKDRKIR